MSKRLGVSTVFIYALIAGIAFLLIACVAYPLVNTWAQKYLGIIPAPKEGAPPTGYVYSGPLTITLNTYDLYDDAAQNPDDTVDIKVWHADGVTPVGTATTLDGTDSISGTVDTADNAILYLSIDHDTGTTEYYLDAKTDSVNTMLIALSPKDVDADGVLEHYFKLDLTSLTPLQAGETSKAVTLNLYCMPADVSGLDWTAVLNPTSASLDGSSYVDLTAEGYMTAVTEGCGFKIVRVELTMPDSGNETYVENGKVKNVWVQIGSDKWTTLSWQPGQDRFLVWEASDVTQEVYGKEEFYAKNAGTTWLRYYVHIQGAGFTSTYKWNPTLKITVINPAGTISTVTESITFTDTA